MERLGPTSTLSVATLSPYLRSGIRCPEGQTGYPPFVVLNGPVCPNGHKFEPGKARPLRANYADRKLGGLYREFGFTNLLDRGTEKGRRED